MSPGLRSQLLSEGLDLESSSQVVHSHTHSLPETRRPCSLVEEAFTSHFFLCLLLWGTHLSTVNHCISCLLEYSTSEFLAELMHLGLAWSLLGWWGGMQKKTMAD